MRRWPKWTWQLIPLLPCGVTWALLPVYAGEGVPSDRNSCLSHVKQLTLGLIMYSDDSEGKPPLRDSWMTDSEPYTKNFGIEHCSKVQEPGLYGYAFNASVKTLKDDAAPARTRLVYDSVNYAKNASDLGDSIPQPGRHKGRNNVSFVDGHAKSIDPRQRASQ